MFACYDYFVNVFIDGKITNNDDDVFFYSIWYFSSYVVLLCVSQKQ